MIKRLKQYAAGVLAVLMTACCVMNLNMEDSYAARTGRVNVSALNIRSSASTSSGIKGVLYGGAKIDIKNQTGNWYEMTAVLDGKQISGYVYSSYIDTDGAVQGSSGGQNTSGGGFGVVNVGALNVRSGASTSTSVVNCLSGGTQITILETLDGWYKMSAVVNGAAVTGYVYAAYVTRTGGTSGGSQNSSGSVQGGATGTGVVNVSALNVRSGAGTDYARVGCIYRDTKVNIRGTSGEWYKITAGNVSGYAFAEYITKTGGQASENNGDGSSSGGGTASGSGGNASGGAASGSGGNSSGNAASGSGGNASGGAASGSGGNASSGGQTSPGQSGSSSNGNFEQQLAAFPESYRQSLRALHEKYPKWIFKAIDTGLDWNTVVKEESVFRRNTVDISSFGGTTNFGQLSTDSGAYDWGTDTYTICDGRTWYSASSDLISYYLDPRNFLDERSIFSFESLAFDSVQKKSVVESILSTTYMKNPYTETDPSTGQTYTRSYADTFMEAGEKAGASPYFLAARARTEGGPNGSGSTSGTYGNYKGYYNFFNIGASDGRDAVANGLQFASKTDPNYLLPWNTRYKSIVGGAKYIAQSYINVGQNTAYFQKFNVHGNSNLYWHQYMTAVHGAFTQAAVVYQSYKTYGVLDDAIIFYIPFYKNMPASPLAKPNAGNPNPYLRSLTLSDGGVTLTPSFNYDTYKYSVVVPHSVDSVRVSASPVSKYAKGVTGTGTYNLAAGRINVISVTCTAGNGTTQTYTINIYRQ